MSELPPEAVAQAAQIDWKRGEPLALEDVQRWARTVRRAPGSPWRGMNQHYQEGPWHAITPGGGQAWCSARPERLASELRVGRGVPVGGKVCAKCVKALATGLPVPYRGRR